MVGKTKEGSDSVSRKPRTRIVTKSFALKAGEQVKDVRIALGSAPVGGKGPRPKMDVILTFVVAPALAKSPQPKKSKKLQFSAAFGSTAQTAKKKGGREAATGVQAPVGGAGRKRKVNP